jgi:hypothetical protein
VFWVISVYFNIRNTLPNSGTFLLGHSVYIHTYTYIYIAGRRRGRCTIAEDDEVLSPAEIREQRNECMNWISYVNMTFLISLPFMRNPYVGNISLPPG